MPESQSLPLLLAGPIIRRLEPDRLVFWLAVTAAAEVRLTLRPEDGHPRDHRLRIDDSLHLLQAGISFICWSI